MNIRFYEIDEKYIDYLADSAPHLFHNKQPNQKNKRKYIGIVLSVNGFDYFAPLSSFKDKHKSMSEGMDFLKVENYAVINLNNMFPATLELCSYVDFKKEPDPQYRKLLETEYRIIKNKQDKILKNALNLYQYKAKHGNNSPLAKRCNNFHLLEEKLKLYK